MQCLGALSAENAASERCRALYYVAAAARFASFVGDICYAPLSFSYSFLFLRVPPVTQDILAALNNSSAFKYAKAKNVYNI